MFLLVKGQDITKTQIYLSWR